MGIPLFLYLVELKKAQVFVIILWVKVINKLKTLLFKDCKDNFIQLMMMGFALLENYWIKN